MPICTENILVSSYRLIAVDDLQPRMVRKGLYGYANSIEKQTVRGKPWRQISWETPWNIHPCSRGSVI